MNTIEVTPLIGLPEITRGDDLAQIIIDACEEAAVTLRDGDVVCVAQKVVSKAEGAVVDSQPGDSRMARRAEARRQAVRVVAETDDVLIVETRHGFVCANGGVDASNMPAGRLGLLPANPDASAESLRQALMALSEAQIGVVITDTFGRPWRVGQTDVAIGCAGIEALRDERGGLDRQGRELEVTIVAIADEIAAAADLARRKADGTAVVIVRGAATSGTGTGRDLVRPAEDDLFRWGGPQAVDAAIAGRRTVRAFDARPVELDSIRAGVRAAVTAPAPHHTKPWRFVRVRGQDRVRLLDAMAKRWRDDLTADGVDSDVIERRIERSDDVLRDCPELVIPFVLLDRADKYADFRREVAERDMFMLAGGAGIQNFMMSLAGRGVGTAWISSTLFCADVVRDVLGKAETWLPLGALAVGYPDATFAQAVRGDANLDSFLLDS